MPQCEFSSTKTEKEFWSCLCNVCYKNKIKPILDYNYILFDNGVSLTRQELINILIYSHKEYNTHMFSAKMTSDLNLADMATKKYNKLQHMCDFYNNILGNKQKLKLYKNIEQFVWKTLIELENDKSLLISPIIAKEYMKRIFSQEFIDSEYKFIYKKLFDKCLKEMMNQNEHEIFSNLDDLYYKFLFDESLDQISTQYSFIGHRLWTDYKDNLLQFMTVSNKINIDKFQLLNNIKHAYMSCSDELYDNKVFTKSDKISSDILAYVKKLHSCNFIKVNNIYQMYLSYMTSEYYINFYIEFNWDMTLITKSPIIFIENI